MSVSISSNGRAVVLGWGIIILGKFALSILIGALLSEWQLGLRLVDWESAGGLRLGLVSRLSRLC